jgi:hypothetical protein
MAGITGPAAIGERCIGSSRLDQIAATMAARTITKMARVQPPVDGLHGDASVARIVAHAHPVGSHHAAA